MTDEFTSTERNQLKGHFSNPDKAVFAIITPSQVDRGALMSRYSRSSNSMRRIFLDEFLTNPNRGERFYERVLSEYGDDSVAELGLVQIGVEGLSNIAIQTVEDRRLGLSFLEKSSRYVFWDKKIDGHFAYYKGKDVMESRHEKAYTSSCELSFETYSKLTAPMLKYMEEVTPIESHTFFDSESNTEKPFSQLTQSQDVQAAQRIYKGTLKARTSDALRSLLPASTLTNVGIAGNGRAFEYLISVLKSSPLNEVQKLGSDIYNELTATARAFVKRAGDKYGLALQEYMVKLSKQSDKISLNTDVPLQHCTKMPFYTPPEDALNLVISGLLYENSHRTFGSLYGIVKDMPKSKKRKIIKSFTNLRQNRRHRPPRAFELVSYTFDLINNYGMFRDMHRHRVLTMQRQPLSTRHGFTIPDDIIQAGFSQDFHECMNASKEAYNTIHTDAPSLSQYVVNFAYNYPYMLKVNLRELCHIIELRTLPQGHSDYRDVTQEMYRCLQKVHPDLVEIIKFVNLDRYGMGRMGSEKRSEIKRKKLA
ncbi:MAG: thymidylate synthase [Cenarchaeum sp. SB0675_bin_21]|nr:thymidylate synthase [Cenarchaeum sp. SB0675_bin_21]